MSRLLSALALALPMTLAAGTTIAAGDAFPRWKPLFNGKDTTGWVNAKKGDGKCSWKVEDGTFTNGRDRGDDVCTVDEFGDYLLELDFKSKPTGDGNGGVYLRGWVEVQIFNSTANHKGKLRDFDGGAIYGAGAPKANPHNPQGEWNHYRILHTGDTITVWLNGVIVQDHTVRAAATPGHIAKHPVTGRALDGKRGPVMLQGDHNHLWFRNIRILELPEGWKPLWNGTDLSELTLRDAKLDAAIGEYWKVEDGALFNPRYGHTGGHDAWTRKAFGNFLVHYEYRSNPKVEGGNSGFYLRDQWEIQILSRQATGERGKHGDGALYSLKSPDVLARNGPEEWNVVDVKLVGNKVWVWQNGKLIHDGVELTMRTDNHRKTEVFSRAPFKLQGDHGQVWFRNLFIRELPDGARL